MRPALYRPSHINTVVGIIRDLCHIAKDIKGANSVTAPKNVEEARNQ